MRCAVCGPQGPARLGRVRRDAGRALLVLAATTLVGCGGGETDGLKRNISALRDEVTLLHNTVDRLEERLAAAEAQNDAALQSSAHQSQSVSPGTFERPRLKVVKVRPGQEQVPTGGPADAPAPAPVSDDDSSEPRPVIRGSGDRIETELPAGPTSQGGCLDEKFRAKAQDAVQTRDRCRGSDSRGG
jgi:hypothetical protein